MYNIMLVADHVIIYLGEDFLPTDQLFWLRPFMVIMLFNPPHEWPELVVYIILTQFHFISLPRIMNLYHVLRIVGSRNIRTRSLVWDVFRVGSGYPHRLVIGSLMSSRQMS